MNPSPQALVTAQANVFHHVNLERDWVRSVNPTDDHADFVHLAHANPRADLQRVLRRQLDELLPGRRRLREHGLCHRGRARERSLAQRQVRHRQRHGRHGRRQRRRVVDVLARLADRRAGLLRVRLQHPHGPEHAGVLRRLEPGLLRRGPCRRRGVDGRRLESARPLEPIARQRAGRPRRERLVPGLE